MKGRLILPLLVLGLAAFPSVDATVYESFTLRNIPSQPLHLDAGDRIYGSFNLSTSDQSYISQLHFVIETAGQLDVVYQIKQLTLLAPNQFDYTTNQTNSYFLNFISDWSSSGYQPTIMVQLSYDINRHFDWTPIAIAVVAGAALTTGVVVYLKRYQRRRHRQKKLTDWPESPDNQKILASRDFRWVRCR